MKTISNWGNYPRVQATVSEFTSAEQASGWLQKNSEFIVRGSGLCYGDASLSKSILSSARFNRILHFDNQQGIITVEAGATLDDVLKTVVPKGFFLPVTPGTKYITVGGAVAGDVHGKNHHAEGSFCRYVMNLSVMLASGEIKNCNRTENTELFNIVCGGLGLNGIILTVQFRLKAIRTSFIRQRNIVVKNLDQMLAELEKFNAATYSVAWIDCLAGGNQLGRGVLMLGEHAGADEVKKENKLSIHSKPKWSIPFSFPSFVLNQLSIRLFNWAYYNKHAIGKKEFIVHYDPFFYPLDFVRNWNKMYGTRGFLQYQFVIPFHAAAEGLRDILEAISRSGVASFLAVLKAMGEGEHMLSFPMKGFTLALDFPVSSGIFDFLSGLDQKITGLGGRIYLVKDARMSKEDYWKGYPGAKEFRDLTRKYDPSGKFSSILAKRLQMI